MDPARLRALKMDLEHLCGLIPSVQPCFPGPRLHAHGTQSYDAPADGDGSFYSEQPTEYGDAEDEAVFHAHLDANPDDTTARLVYADWLEERGDPRAAGYRALGMLGKSPIGNPFVFWGPERNRDFGDWMDRYEQNLLPEGWWNAVPREDHGNMPDWKYHDNRREAEDAAAHAFSQLHPDEQKRILQSAQPQQGNDMPTQNSHYSEYADPAGYPQAQTEIPGQLRPLPRPGGIMAPVGRPAAVTGRPPFRTGPAGARVTGSPRLGHLTRSFQNLLAQLRQRGMYSQYASRDYAPVPRGNAPVPPGWDVVGTDTPGGHPNWPEEPEPQGDPVQDFHDAYNDWQSDVRMGHAGPQDEPLPEHFGLNDADVGRYAAYSEFDMPSYPQAQNVGGLTHPAWASMPLPAHALGYAELDENFYPIWPPQDPESVWGGEAGPAHQPTPSPPSPQPRPGFGAHRPPPPPQQNRNRGAAGMDPNEPQLPYGEFSLPSLPHTANNVGGITHPAWASMPLPQHALGYGDLSPQKAREILHDGTVHGHPLTDKQRRFMGWKSHQTNHAAYATDYDLNEQRAFEAHLDAHPEDHVARRAYADWLRENGAARQADEAARIAAVGGNYPGMVAQAMEPRGSWRWHDAFSVNRYVPSIRQRDRQWTWRKAGTISPKLSGPQVRRIHGNLPSTVHNQPLTPQQIIDQGIDPDRRYAAYAAMPTFKSGFANLKNPHNPWVTPNEGFWHGHAGNQNYADPHSDADPRQGNPQAPLPYAPKRRGRKRPAVSGGLVRVREYPRMKRPDPAQQNPQYAAYDASGEPPTDRGDDGFDGYRPPHYPAEPARPLGEPREMREMQEPTSEYCGMDDSYAPVSTDLFTEFTNLAAQLAQLAPGSTSSYCSYNSAEPDPNANLSDARAVSGQTGDLSGNSPTWQGYASYDRGGL